MLKLILDDSDTVNVARHCPASQSSTSEWSAPNESGRAVSGIRQGSLSFHTSPEPFPWWQVDLQRSYPLDAIVVWNRDDDLAFRARSLRIHVSPDGSQWTLVHAGVTYFGGLWTSRPLVHFLGGEIEARFVRVSLEEDQPLHLAQVEVLVSNDSLALEHFWQSLASVEPAFHPAPTKFPYRAAKGSMPGHDLAITALKLEPYGRFGNNFHQTFNASLLARLWGIETIILPRGRLLGAVAAGAAGGLHFVHEGEDRCQRVLSGKFYFLDYFAAFHPRITLDDLARTLEACVRPQYSTLLERARPAAPDTMHFHFRSGDVFMPGTPHMTYLQPPLAFYTAALVHATAHAGIRRAVVVYEDRQNPCVGAFIEYLNARGIEHRAVSGPLEDDVAELLGARVICQSFGTFTESVLCLSEHAVAAYAFREVAAFGGHNKPPGCGVQELLLKRGVALHVIKDVGPHYLARDTWDNSKEQRDVMLSFPESALIVERL